MENRYVALVICMILVTIVLSGCAAPIDQDSNQKWMVITNNGNKFIGPVSVNSSGNYIIYVGGYSIPSKDVAMMSRVQPESK